MKLLAGNKVVITSSIFVMEILGQITRSVFKLAPFKELYLPPLHVIIIIMCIIIMSGILPTIISITNEEQPKGDERSRPNCSINLKMYAPNFRQSAFGQKNAIDFKTK
jgi:hypothetical protein